MNINALLSSTQIDPFEARLLLSHVLWVNSAYLMTHGEEKVSLSECERFNILKTRREQGEPIAYILGKKEFWSMDFIVNKHTLIPRPETELLVEIMQEKIDTAACWNFLELGTGSGAISIALGKLYGKSHVVASEVDEEALSVAMRNKLRHDINNVDFILSDWFSKLYGRFHAIVSNPPYLSEDDPHLQKGDVLFEPVKALVGGKTGLEAYQCIISKAHRYLVEGGFVFLEHGCAQGEQVRSIFKENSFENIETRKDLSGLDRVTFARHSGIN